MEVLCGSIGWSLGYVCVLSQSKYWYLRSQCFQLLQALISISLVEVSALGTFFILSSYVFLSPPSSHKVEWPVLQLVIPC